MHRGNNGGNSFYLKSGGRGALHPKIIPLIE
jgi:hypothetical protein